MSLLPNVLRKHLLLSALAHCPSTMPLQNGKGCLTIRRIGIGIGIGITFHPPYADPFSVPSGVVACYPLSLTLESEVDNIGPSRVHATYAASFCAHSRLAAPLVTMPPTQHSHCSLTFKAAAERILCPKPLVCDEVRADDLSGRVG
jgi:hypothetical protein